MFRSCRYCRVYEMYYIKEIKCLHSNTLGNNNAKQL